MNILSFGAGVNSTAILALAKLGKVEVDKIIFADTGAENPETYCHIHALQKEFDIEVVKRDPGLYDWCIERKIIPTRMLRWCTDKWKIRPIYEKLKEEKIIDYKMVIGFCKGEEKRVKNRHEAIYPLIDLGIDREGCKRLILEQGWTIPPKSGCFFCPFQPKKEWQALKENRPDLFDKAVELEKNCSRNIPNPFTEEIENPMYLYGDKPLTRFNSSQQRLSPLDGYQHCLCGT